MHRNLLIWSSLAAFACPSLISAQASRNNGFAGAHSEASSAAGRISCPYDRANTGPTATASAVSRCVVYDGRSGSNPLLAGQFNVNLSAQGDIQHMSTTAHLDIEATGGNPFLHIEGGTGSTVGLFLSHAIPSTPGTVRITKNAATSFIPDFQPGVFSSGYVIIESYISVGFYHPVDFAAVTVTETRYDLVTGAVTTSSTACDRGNNCVPSDGTLSFSTTELESNELFYIYEESSVNYSADAVQSLPGTMFDLSADVTTTFSVEDVEDVDATPEPASLTLVATGMISLLGFGFRRRKNINEC